jgi:hypothetical protein
MHGIFAVKISLSVFLAVSLRTLWQMMSICQVIVHFRFLLSMPASAHLANDILKYVINLEFIPIEWL